MKRSTMIVIVAISVIALVFSLAACVKDETVYDGKDAYGRSFGEIYEIGSEETGIFRIPYVIEDTSAVGKSMISSNCADYVEVKKDAEKYEFTYLCKKGMLGKVSLVREDGDVNATEGEKDGYQSFTFDLTEDELRNKIALKCVVTLMKKTVNFSVRPDLTQAKLVG